MEYPINYDSPAEMRNFLQESDLSMKKRFGQNFLVNRGAREKLISFLNPGPGDRVWEIGPGLGAMTWHLLDGGSDVTAFEIDHGFIGLLGSFYGALPNFSLVEGDFLKTFKNLPGIKDEPPSYILGNLPYITGSVMIAELVRSELDPEGMVFTLQKEVGLRMAAEPGNPVYSGYSLICQSKYDIILRGDLKPGSFYPKPAVTSSIIELRPHGRFNPGSAEIYYSLVEDLFRSRRKKIRNNLLTGKTASAAGPDRLMEAVRSTGVSTDVRAETLGVEQVEKMSRAIHEFTK